MEISLHGLDILDDVEGIKLTAYPDPATGGEPWTIGIGSTYVDGKKVVKGLAITKEQAYEACREYLHDEVYPIIKECVTVPLTQNQFDALCSFIYNIGTTAFKKSTCLKLLNKGKYQQASLEFGKWVRANGKVMKGLVNRRRIEQELFNSK